MNPTQIIGAIRFPAFLLLWSAGLVLFMGQLYPADAALVSDADRERSLLVMAELPSVPSVMNLQGFDEALDRALRASDLVAGRWQPPASQEVAEQSSRPVAHPRMDPPVAAAPSVERTPAGISKVVAAPVRRSSDPLAEVKRAARAALSAHRPAHAYALLMGDVGRGRSDSEFLGLLGVAAITQRQFTEAEIIYTRLVELEPHADRWWAGLALAQQRLGLNPQQSYRQLLSLADEASPLRRLAAEALERG